MYYLPLPLTSSVAGSASLSSSSVAIASASLKLSSAFLIASSSPIIWSTNIIAIVYAYSHAWPGLYKTIGISASNAAIMIKSPISIIRAI